MPDLSLFLAGDALITEPWSGIEDASFRSIIDEMRAADLTVVNLETVIHEYKGYAQSECGGTYMASPPEIAAELKWAGVDMVAAANNHSFDYGSTGILETLEHTAAAGISLAGIGADLQAARAPAYWRNGKGTVGLVSMAADYISFGRASRSTAGLRGRPGLNPLTPTAMKVAAAVTPTMAETLLRLKFWRRKRQKIARGRIIRAFGLRFLVADELALTWGRTVDPADRDANLAAIAQAAAQADLTIASVHAHKQSRWLRRFARDAIEAGADIVFMHGPHEVRGIEFHDKKPIFYCMGDFVFQPHRIRRFPAEFYDGHGLKDDAELEETQAAMDSLGDGLGKNPKTFEAFCAVLDYRESRLDAIRLLPLDLQLNASHEIRGRPRKAGAALGRAIIEEVATLSKRYGTSVRYDPERNLGMVDLPGG